MRFFVNVMIVLSYLASPVFFLWAIKSAWLTAVPGTDKDYFSRAFGIQLAISAALILLPTAILIIRGRRRRRLNASSFSP
jgi:hypothetical protein